MPFTTPIIDDFNRANEYPLSQGGHWQTRNDSAGQVLSNQYAPRASPTGRYQQVYIGVGPFTDCEGYVTVATPNDWSLVTARNQAGTNLSLNKNYCVQSGAGSFIVLKKVSNTETFLASTTHAVSAGDQIGIRCIGTTIEGWHKPAAGSWSLILSATDSSWASGFLGMEQGNPGGGAIGRLDDFGGGAIVSTAIKTIMGVSYPSNVKTAIGLAQASVKKIDGLA